MLDSKGNPKQFYVLVDQQPPFSPSEDSSDKGRAATLSMVSSGMQLTVGRSRLVSAFSNRLEKYIQRDGCGLFSVQ